MPPLMKLWLDEVFAFGWAYGPGGQALQGKDLWLVATSTGGPEESYRPDSYNRYFFDAFLPPYEQTAALAGMRFLPPLVLHGAHRARAMTSSAHAACVPSGWAAYPDWPELDDMDACARCPTCPTDRPAGLARSGGPDVAWPAHTGKGRLMEHGSG
jgi:glutathione-regulated potassium-efflux system ancillary protein KefF